MRFITPISLPRVLVSGLTGALTVLAIAAHAGVIDRPGQPLAAAPFSAERVVPGLLSRLNQGARADFVIEFSERADLSAARTMDWSQRGRYVFDALRETAERSQASLRSALRADGVEVKSYWIKNVMVVRDGDLAAAQTAMRFEQVERVVELPEVRLLEPEAQVSTTHRSGLTDNLAHVGADQVWARGTSGAGVTVGVIDVGVRYTHEAIVHQYRGNLGNGQFDHDYNWQGPGPEPATPDQSNHATHVIGTIVGDNRAADPEARERIGMAPDARWIACHGLRNDVFEPEIPLLECGQFMLAPTRIDGSDPDPDKRPHAVNNSWGESNCDGTTTGFYADVVENWVAAGIFPIFAVGNTSNCFLPQPPGLSTVTNPASLGTAFAIGSSGNHDGQYAPHSLWGPTTDPVPEDPAYPDAAGYPYLKPQVVAPGVAIRSASAEDDASYMTMTGTSMSAPHIAGLVALMLDAGECLAGDYATLGGIIMETARPVPYDSGGLPPPGPGNVPNYATGWGEIDAEAAVNAAADLCGPSGTLGGRVTDKTGEPVAGARVEMFAGQGGQGYEVLTGPDGRFVRRLPIPADDEYTVRVSAYGYLPAEETGVVIYPDQTTALNLILPAAPFHRIEGEVSDADTGWPLHARLEVAGAPVPAIWTDPVTGHYSIELPQGSPYTLEVSSEIPGYPIATASIADLTGGMIMDFPLIADAGRCRAPGYTFANTVFLEDFSGESGSVPPTGWDSSSSGLGWMFGTAEELASHSFPVPANGEFAAANDELGAGDGVDNDGRFDYLTLPAQNLLGLNQPVLTYRSYHDFDPGPIGSPPREPAIVEASTDGGSTWVVLGYPSVTDAVGGWTSEAIDLTPVIGDNVLIRFHADDLSEGGMFGALGPGWAIDDVAIRTDCVAPSVGGLIIGQTRDANTGAALNGVKVGMAGSVPVLSGDNPDFGPGYFALHAEPGTLVANPGVTLPSGYGEAQLSVSPGTGQAVRQDIMLPAGQLRIYPAGPAASVELGSTGASVFTMANTGGQTLNFGFEGEAVEEHFEQDFPPVGWQVDTVGSDCTWQWQDPLTHPNLAGGDGRSAMVNPIDCLDASGTDTALMTMPVDLTDSTTASIGFFLSFHEPGIGQTRLDIDVTSDGGGNWLNLFTQTEVISSAGPGTLVELDMSDYAGETVQLRFRFQSDTPWSRVLIDQFHLFGTINNNDMLTLSPDAGALLPGSNTQVQATFDASGIAQPGVHRVPVRIAEDTPYPFTYGDFMATMTVTAPASYGSVAGQVHGLGKCDAGATPLAGAEVLIESSGGLIGSTFADETGHYEYWMDAASGPFSVTVVADNYLNRTLEIDLSAGESLPVDVELRSLEPCLSTNRNVLQASLPVDGNAERGFTLTNSGPVPSDWAIRAGGDPEVLTPDVARQTNSSGLEQFVSFSCINPATGSGVENRYFRIFPMSEHSEARLVEGISFAVDNSSSGAGIQPITVRLHRLEGEFVLANLSALAEMTVDVADTELERIEVAFDQPLVVDSADVLVAEIYVPDGTDGGNLFYPGGNRAGASAPAYHAAADCGYEEPLSYDQLDLGWVNLVLELNVLTSDPCGPVAVPVTWLSFNPSGGAIDGDATSPFTAVFDAVGQAEGSHQGTACLADDSGEPQWQAIPTWMHVGTAGDRIFYDRFQ